METESSRHEVALTTWRCLSSTLVGFSASGEAAGRSPRLALDCRVAAAGTGCPTTPPTAIESAWAETPPTYTGVGREDPPFRGFSRLRCFDSEPETAGLGISERDHSRSSLLRVWMVRAGGPVNRGAQQDQIAGSNPLSNGAFSTMNTTPFERRGCPGRRSLEHSVGEETSFPSIAATDFLSVEVITRLG